MEKDWRRGDRGVALSFRIPSRLTAITGLIALFVSAQGCAPHLSSARLAALAQNAGGLGGDAEARLARTMGADIVALSLRTSAGREDPSDRPLGWSTLDLRHSPTLGFAGLSPEEAERINAFLPASLEAPAPAAPFYLRGPPAEQQRALLCLTQAVYYEAALEPLAGQQAVAQTVLNRVRNPAFPNSICGVVYQGSQQVTGCQFSFTCDGSLGRPPVAPFWQRAQAVAKQAVSGFVMAAVGTATHYHADYVLPNWGPSLVKIGQFGAQIFYRFPGPLGGLSSFRQGYGGGELKVSMAGPTPDAVMASAADIIEASAAAPPVKFEIADPTAASGSHQRVAGEIVFGRRLPTHDEITRINGALAAMDKARAAVATPSAPADDAPIKTAGGGGE